MCVARSSAGVAGRTDLAPTNYPGNYFRDAPQAMVDAGFLTKSPGEASYHMDKGGCRAISEGNIP